MSREKVVEILESWIGLKEADGSHKKIIEIYNSIRPLPKGYKVKTTDAWCAATISAAYHEAGEDAIFPMESSCQRMIEKAQKMGIWVENDAYTPQKADAILYDWQDAGLGDCKGAPDHVGAVQKVENGIIYVIEGNYSDKVGIRKIKLNGKFIRGFIAPKFTEEKQSKDTGSQNEATDPQTIWTFFTQKGLNEYGVAGLMGNLQAESGLNPTNLQNSYEKKLGYTDSLYTEAVDNGSYTNFAKDSAGYGLAQWTYWTRKQALLEYAKESGSSIGDLQMQMEFLWKELQGKKAVLNTLKNATSVKEASDVVLTKFERPADQSDAVKAKRESYGIQFYNKYAEKKEESGYIAGKTYTLRANMFVRDAPRGDKKKLTDMTTDGQKHAIKQEDGTAVLKKGTVVTCMEKNELSDGSIWIRIPSGWVCAKSVTGMAYVS